MPKKLITLDELSRYDGKIKEYVSFYIINKSYFDALTTSSTQEEIMQAFGGSDNFNNLLADIPNGKRVLIGVFYSYMTYYTEAIITLSNLGGLSMSIMYNEVGVGTHNVKIKRVYDEATQSNIWNVELAEVIDTNVESCTNSDIDNLFINGGGE